MEDWRFRESPYVELGGLMAYAGVPLRLQNESGDCVGLGTLCVASSTSQEPLSKIQQQTLTRLADCVVSDIIQCARARRQRERHRMSELVSTAQREIDAEASEEPIFRILKTTYPDAVISLQSSIDSYIEVEGCSPILLSDLEDGVWEDVDYLDDFIASSNHRDFPATRVVRVITAQCESIPGPSLLVVASKDFRLVFDDVDAWFVQTCAAMLSQLRHKQLLMEVMRAKERFLQGISHQLRTPIHGILGSVELLAEELKSWNWSAAADSSEAVSTLLEATAAAGGSGGQSIYLDTIRTAGQDLISIVNSMITLNRWADIAMTDRCYAMHTVYELEAELAGEISKLVSGNTRYTASVLFKNDLPPNCDSLWVDLNLLRDSLLPIVINAIQNTPGGTVRITTSIRPGSKELTVDIEDTGRGIHPDDQQRIFEAYEKVGVHTTGAGLGLTLASKFAQLLHGSVVLVSSAVDRGSHFRATFRDIECVYSPPALPPLSSKLKNLPSEFHYVPSASDSRPVSDHFAKFLTSHGFTGSGSLDNGLCILDFVHDLDQHRANLSHIPFDQAVICLIPSSEREPSLQQTPNNIVYVSGPFTTLTMSLALEEADRLVAETRTSQGRWIRSGEPPVTIWTSEEAMSSAESSSAFEGWGTDEDRSTDGNTITDESPYTDEGAEPTTVCCPPNSNGRITQPAPEKPPDPGLDGLLLQVDQPDLVVALETTAIIPIYTAPATTSRPTALLVDDNVVNLRIMQMYCSKRGLPYHCATDGRQAVEIFSRHQTLSARGDGPAIQLVLMDLQMPVCDGIEATREIRLLEEENKWGQSVLFIVTGQDSPADRNAANGAGADDYYVKPVSMKALDRGVKRYFPAFEPK